MAEALLDLQLVGGGAGQLGLGLRSRLRNARREREAGEEEGGNDAERGACHAPTVARAVPIGRRNDAPAPMFDSPSPLAGESLVSNTRKTQLAAVLFAGMVGFAGVAHAVDSDRVEGDSKQVTGTIKEKSGELFGSQKLESEGRSERQNGQVESAWGKFKDSIRDFANSIEEKFSSK